MEKHSRGSLARSHREIRIQEKEKRKMLKENRTLKKEPNRSRSLLNAPLQDSLGINADVQQFSSSVNLGKAAYQPQQSGLIDEVATRGRAQPPFLQPQHSGFLAANMGVGPPRQVAALLQHAGLSDMNYRRQTLTNRNYYHQMILPWTKLSTTAAMQILSSGKMLLWGPGNMSNEAKREYRSMVLWL